jgi:hypothetical protein
MTKSLGFRLLGCWLSLLLVAGCGGEKASDGGGAPKQPGQIDVEELPGVGDYLPRILDDGRMKVAPPTGWLPAELPIGYLVRFMPEHEKGKFPSILIKAEAFAGEPSTVTADNLDQFVQQVKSRLADEKKPNVKVEPRRIGDFAGAFYDYVVRSKDGSERDHVVLETAFDGRLYSFQLHTVKGESGDYLKYLYAVAKGVQFVTEEPAEPKPEQAQPQPDEKEQPQPEEKAEPKNQGETEAPAAKPADKADGADQGAEKPDDADPGAEKADAADPGTE